MKAIQNWAKSQGGWSHVMAGVIFVAGLEWARDPEFHARVIHLWSLIPETAQDIVFVVGMLVLLYIKTQKKDIIQDPQTDPAGASPLASPKADSPSVVPKES